MTIPQLTPQQEQSQFLTNHCMEIVMVTVKIPKLIKIAVDSNREVEKDDVSSKIMVNVVINVKKKTK